jgi:hypothetical protein
MIYQDSILEFAPTLGPKRWGVIDFVGPIVVPDFPPGSNARKVSDCEGLTRARSNGADRCSRDRRLRDQRISSPPKRLRFLRVGRGHPIIPDLGERLPRRGFAREISKLNTKSPMHQKRSKFFSRPRLSARAPMHVRMALTASPIGPKEHKAKGHPTAPVEVRDSCGSIWSCGQSLPTAREGASCADVKIGFTYEHVNKHVNTSTR